MAYADYEFYKTSYFGTAVPDTEFARVSEKASDFIDRLTCDRLVDWFPKNEHDQKRIKKAVCSLADIMFQMDIAEKNALSLATMNGSSVQGKAGEYDLVCDDEGNIKLVKNASGISSTGDSGVVISKSSGNESVTYASPDKMATSSKEWNKIYSVVGDQQKANELLIKTALPLLMGVRTDEGLPILYAGL